MKVRFVLLALMVVLAAKAAVLYQLGHHPLLDPVGELDGAYYRHLAEMVAGGDVLPGFTLSLADLFGEAR